MGLDNLLYYIINLIVEGHRWQYQNATCSNRAPRLYFTTFQWVALGLALVFVLTKPSGLNNDIIDYLLSSLSIMTGSLLFGHETHFSEYCLASNLADVDWLLTARLVIVVFVRFVLVYFLLDFFILAVYAITSLFQFVNVKMNEKQPSNPLEGVRVLTDRETLKRVYPRLSVIAKITIWITLVTLVLYELEPICYVFKKLWLMVSHSS